MYLKYLELQGFKSFARKTEFAFDQGITAIVGPNGSGKSNIADAVRWLLGETRMTQLRAKVTDNLIFAGSEERARLGMARAAATLDNSDGTLSIDYTEVTVERRAYRDGQNEYLINGTKVRLRDIVELLGAGGLTRDAYSVIGQGLVDTALSLRPQERRALIDVAAGIRPLQDKRDRALAQLDETRDNLTRVRDIIAEIEPRLRRLEKQADRARQGAQMAEELAEVLQTWYGYQWHTGRQALKDAQAKADAARQALTQRRQALAALEGRIEGRRDREEAQTEALSELREQRAEVRTRYETVRRELAVRRERLSLLQRRQRELTTEITDLQTQREAQQSRLADTETALAGLNDRHQQLEVQVEAMRDERAGTQQRQAEYQFALEGARQKALELKSSLADALNQLETLEERRQQLVQERASQQDALADLTAQVDNRQAALSAAQQKTEAYERRLQRLAQEREEAQAALDAASARLDRLTGEVETARRRLEQLAARREALAEMRRDDASGAQALLNARDELPGVVGSVASLIHVPAEYETAIEAALGANSHAVVVETWDDARRAIAWLQANGAGRATLVVLEGSDGTEDPQGPRERRSGGAEEQGSIGVAAGLVDCEPRFRPLIRRLLGHVVVVDTLETVRQVPFSSSLVPFHSPVFATLDGTVVHPAGQITGGALQSSVLRLERLWRELPAQIEAAGREVEHLASGQADAQASVEALSSRLVGIAAELDQVRSARVEAQATSEGAQRDLAALDREITWRRDVVDRRSQELEAIQDRIEDLQGQMNRIQVLQADAQQRVEALQAELSGLESEDLRDRLAEAEKQLAGVQRDRQIQQARQDDLVAAVAGVDRQIGTKRGQTDALAAEVETLEDEIGALAGDEGRLSNELAALEAEIEPVAEAVRTMRREGRELEREATRARDLLRQAETAASEASLEVQRREDRLVALRDKIADDLELAAVAEELPQQLMLALEGETEVLPAVTQIPEGLERRVQQLRRQMRQLGSASPELLAEYEATKERYDFLTSQAADLEEAAGDLRAVAGELTQVMTEQFDATFDEVAKSFTKYFRQLFGGGEAHLSLMEDESEDASPGLGAGEPGLEITARPPGKRSQSLALLSGGERALTAVALLFSLLKASPTPFCILDEVDAMLDEANIGRFRSALDSLAQETQFIIITHNRGTIQAAGTIYGISMGDEGVSQAISLKLDELEPVAA